MLESRLKTIIAACFFASQFGTFISLFIINDQGGFNDRLGEMNTVAMLILPMFAVYTTTIVKAAIADQGNGGQGTNRRVAGLFAGIALSLIILYSLLIPALVWCRGYNILIRSPDDLKLYLTLTQTAFAVYLGLIIDALYKRRA